jgi:hypothetical protein
MALGWAAYTEEGNDKPLAKEGNWAMHNKEPLAKEGNWDTYNDKPHAKEGDWTTLTTSPSPRRATGQCMPRRAMTSSLPRMVLGLRTPTITTAVSIVCTLIIDKLDTSYQVIPYLHHANGIMTG